MDDENIEYQYNDNVRFDNHKNFLSLSVEHPNYKMLHSIAPNEEKKENIAILEIDANILTESNRNMKCSKYNAAKDCGKYVKNLDKDNFKELFDENSRCSNLEKKYPTDPQAEILIEGKVESSYIKKIFLYKNDENIINKCNESFKNKIEVSKDKYYPRADYKNWEKNE